MSNHLHQTSRKEYLQNKHLYNHKNKSIMPTNDIGDFSGSAPTNTPLDFDPNQEKTSVKNPNFEQFYKEQLTFGQKLVGLTFNPSGDEKVNKAKQLCADLADLLHDERNPKATGVVKERSELENQLYNHTIGEILNAQMNCVKLLTLKY